MHFVCTLYTRIIQKAALVKGKIHFFRKKWRKSRMIFHYPFCVRRRVSPLRWRPEGFAVARWTASRPHLSLLRAIATFLVGVPFVPYAALSTNKHETPKVAAPKVSKGRSQTSPVFIALWSPPQRRNPCKQKAILGEKSVFSPILRLHQHHRPQNTILIRVQTQRRIAPPCIIIRLPRA